MMRMKVSVMGRHRKYGQDEETERYSIMIPGSLKVKMRKNKIDYSLICTNALEQLFEIQESGVEEERIYEKKKGELLEDLKGDMIKHQERLDRIERAHRIHVEERQDYRRRELEAWKTWRIETCAKRPPNPTWTEYDPEVLSYFSKWGLRWTVGWIVKNYERLDEEVWPNHDGPPWNPSYQPTKLKIYRYR